MSDLSTVSPGNPRVSASRHGDEYLSLKPVSFTIPGVLADGEIGMNTLVGFREDNGLIEQCSTGTAYSKLAIAVREWPAAPRLRDGDFAHRGIRSHGALKMDTDASINVDQSQIGQTVYAADEHTATFDAADGNGNDHTEVGPIVEVRPDEGMVYVRVTA